MERVRAEKWGVVGGLVVPRAIRVGVMDGNGHGDIDYTSSVILLVLRGVQLKDNLQEKKFVGIEQNCGFSFYLFLPASSHPVVHFVIS